MASGEPASKTLSKGKEASFHVISEDCNETQPRQDTGVDISG